jgi:hypothetical protein
MLGVGADGSVRFEVPLAQRVGQFGAGFQMLEIFTVGEKIENKDVHASSWRCAAGFMFDCR